VPPAADRVGFAGVLATYHKLHDVAALPASWTFGRDYNLT